MIMAGFMFCVGVLLFIVCVALLLTLWKPILIGIAIVAFVGGVGFLWLIDPGAVEGLLALVASLAILCGGTWVSGWVWDHWIGKGDEA